MEFTREEISKIEKSLGFIVFDWAKHLVNHILSQARDKGVDTVYINTPETLDAGAITEGKVDYFYEKLPPLLGFKKEKADLRGTGKETLWAFHLNPKTSSSNLRKLAKQFTLEEFPQRYQGAFLGIIGKKPYYTDEDVNRVLDILQKKQELKPKSVPKFYYDWESSIWTGSQRFNSSISENVVLQKIPSELQNIIERDEALSKFWSFLLAQPSHFGEDSLGFALVSKINKNIWVINEIQTDCINHYLKLRREDKEFEKREKEISIDTLKDMLVAHNKQNWLSKIESNENVKDYLIKNPSIIQNLPNDPNDIDKWIKNNLGTTDLNQALAQTNFNVGIFKL